jgi:hypothetical protein
MLKALREEYKSFFGDLRSYWSCYGGMTRVLATPYTPIAIFVTLASWRSWHAPGWYSTPLSVLPSLLGFTLAAYALLLGFGDEGFLKFLAVTDGTTSARTEEKHISVLTSVSAIFLHFVVVEVLALLLSIIGSAVWPVPSNDAAYYQMSTWQLTFACIATIMFDLAVVLGLAAALNIYHATRWYVQYHRAVDAAQKSKGSLESK